MFRHMGSLVIAVIIITLQMLSIKTDGLYTTILVFDKDETVFETNRSVAIFEHRGFSVIKYSVISKNNLEQIRKGVCDKMEKVRRVVAIVDYSKIREVNTMLHAICQQLRLPYLLMSSAYQIPLRDRKNFQLQLFPGGILQRLLLRDYMDLEWAANRWKEGAIIVSDDSADMENYATLIQEVKQYILIRKWVTSDKDQFINYSMMKALTDRSIRIFIVALKPKDIQQFFRLLAAMKVISLTNQFILVDMDAGSANLYTLSVTGANITSFRIIAGQSNLSHASSGHKHSILPTWRIPVHGTLSKIVRDDDLMTQLSVVASDLIWAALRPINSQLFSKLAWRVRCNDKPWGRGEQLMDSLLKVAANNYSLIENKILSAPALNYSFHVMQLLLDGQHKRSTWTYGKGFHDPASRLEFTQDLEHRLKNVTLRVVTIHDPPFVIFRPFDEYGNKADGNDQWTGLTIELLKRLTQMLKFRYKIHRVSDGKFGTRNDTTGKWNGMIGELIEDKADMAVASLTITYDRERVIDFTTPYMSLGLSIIIRKPKSKADLFQFMAPMSTEIWWLIILAYILVSFVLFLLGRLSPAEWFHQYPCSQAKVNQFTLMNSFWFTFGSMLQQGSDLCPKSPSTRLAGAAWWFFVLIMVASYTANLAAFLTIDRLESDITNVEELSRQSRVSYGTLFGGSTYSFFKNSEIPTYKRMWRSMSRRKDAFLNSTVTGIDWVKRGEYAFILESTLNEYYRERNCDLMPLGGMIDSRGYGIGLPAGSLFRDALSEAILKLKKKQWMEKERVMWLQHYNVSKPCSQKNAVGNAHRQRNQLNKQSVGGVFVCLLVGLAFAMLVCIIETCLRACQVKHKGKGSMSSYFNSQCRLACCNCAGKMEDPPKSEPEEETETPASLLCSCRPLPPADQFATERKYLQNDVSLATVGRPHVPPVGHYYSRNHANPPNPWEDESLLCNSAPRIMPDSRNGVWEPRQDIDFRKSRRLY